MRRHNLGTLLGHVHHNGEISRAALTSRMRLNRSTIAALVAELESLGLVEQRTPSGARSGAGRPSLDVRPGRIEAFVLATELRVDEITVARVGLGGQVLARASGSTPVSRDPEQVADALAVILTKLAAEAPARSRLVGVGVGIPGVVSDDGGLVRFGPNLGWTDVPFVRQLADRLDADVEIRAGNDADLGVMSEHIRGAAIGHDNVVFLSGDVGVGGGVIAGGRAMPGVGGYAGELGHMRMNPRGPVCRCGNRGCWETEIGAHAVASAVRFPHGDLAGLAARLASVRRPNDRLRTVGRSLGAGLANIVNIFNPEVVILGGVLRDVFPVVRDDVLSAVVKGALAAPGEQATITLPDLGADSVLLGAAELAFEPLLEDPSAVLERR
ncbi:ROK family protein [Solicola gregarius]|uniref:ROK family protein n=1 Tax=Solicola gregarius TaxID=2908642 RepID=A0AA46YJR3_9ACTN|nr:ROK family protein [Solicola gregarius]UYM04860.1 ROK family protein [Solicola gregarius]